MGIYDREYLQEDRGPVWLGGRTVVVNLILVNVAIWIADLLSEGKIGDFLALSPEIFHRPWDCWQLLTYGFVHATRENALLHILFNMYGLWLFGVDLEAMYGKVEFLWIYLTGVVFAGLVWVAIEAFQGGHNPLIGASGAVMTLMAVFVLNFPRRIFYIWGIVPLPAWAMGGIWILLDLAMALQNTDTVAHGAHLAGAFYGFLYFRTRWTLRRIVPRRLSWPSFKPRLKIHQEAEPESRDLATQVDEILEKISRSGEASLTRKERDTLERASRRYQRRRQ